MIFLGELRVEARLENLRTISYFIHGVEQRLALTEKTLFEIDLAVEEAATNVMRHAYPAGQTGELVLRLEILDDVLYITFTDWGIPFNPQDAQPYDLSAPVEMRTKGGMGLHLIHSLMDAVVRKTASNGDIPNTLTLIKHVERLQPGAHRPSTQRELNAMRTVSQYMTSSIELGDLLELIVDKLVETIDAERGTLYLVDEEKGELFSRVLQEEVGILQEIRLQVGEGIAGHVAATGQVLNVQRAHNDPRFLRAFDETTGYHTHTVLTAPMRNPQGKIIGVVQLLNKRGGPFTSRDERLLTAMAAQAAISIENARLYAGEMERRLINQELETARRIQKSFLPQSIPQYIGWEIATFWRPMRDVAGDFYDFYTLPDGRLALIIADVSGKGVPAALFMALSATVLRFGMGLNFMPGELMHHTNQAILSSQGSGMFATIFVGYLDPETGVMHFASAGHNPPLLYRAAGGRCKHLQASGVAVGLFQDAEFVQEKVTLEEGDVLVLYTDGITEAIDADEQEFGEGRLEELMIQYADRPCQELSDMIVKTAAAFATEQGIFDDETLVVIKRL